MRTSPMIALIVTSLTLAFPACGGKQKTASVGGDVYLLMQNGDVKRGAANTVRLLADSAPLRQAMNGLGLPTNVTLGAAIVTDPVGNVINVRTIWP